MTLEICLSYNISYCFAELSIIPPTFQKYQDRVLHDTARPIAAADIGLNVTNCHARCCLSLISLPGVATKLFTGLPGLTM